MSAFKDLLQRPVLLTVSPSLSVSICSLNVCVCVCASVCSCTSAGVTANSVHPGIVVTEVLRHYPLMFRLLFNLIGFFFFKVSTLYCRVTVHYNFSTVVPSALSPSSVFGCCWRTCSCCINALTQLSANALYSLPAEPAQRDRCKREQRLKSIPSTGRGGGIAP